MDQTSTDARLGINVKNHGDVSVQSRYQYVLDQVSVLRIVGMSVCSKLNINKSKSDLSVRLGISIKKCEDVNV